MKKEMNKKAAIALGLVGVSAAAGINTAFANSTTKEVVENKSIEQKVENTFKLNTETEKSERKPFYGVITGTNVNVRTGPGTAYRSIGKVNVGDKIDILAAKVDGEHIWVQAKFVNTQGRAKDRIEWVAAEFVDYNITESSNLSKSSSKLLNQHQLNKATAIEVEQTVKPVKETVSKTESSSNQDVQIEESTVNQKEEVSADNKKEQSNDITKDEVSKEEAPKKEEVTDKKQDSSKPQTTPETKPEVKPNDTTTEAKPETKPEDNKTENTPDVKPDKKPGQGELVPPAKGDSNVILRTFVYDAKGNEIYRLMEGESVEILEGASIKGYSIRMSDGSVGYISRLAVYDANHTHDSDVCPRFDDAVQFPSKATDEETAVTIRDTKLYKKSHNSKEYTVIKAGTRLTVTPDISGEQCVNAFVEGNNSVFGYVPYDDIELVHEEDTTQLNEVTDEKINKESSQEDTQTEESKKTNTEDSKKSNPSTPYVISRPLEIISSNNPNVTNSIPAFSTVVIDLNTLGNEKVKLSSSVDGEIVVLEASQDAIESAIGFKF